ATSELGALTEPGLRRPPETGLMGAGPAGAAGMAGAAGAAGGRASSPAPRTSAAPRTQQHPPRRKRSNAGLWLTLILLLAVLAGAVWVLMGQMSDRGTGGPSSSSATTTTESVTEEWSGPTGTTDATPR